MKSRLLKMVTLECVCFLLSILLSSHNFNISASICIVFMMLCAIVGAHDYYKTRSY